VPLFYQKVLIAILLAVLCGEVVVFYFKRYFADKNLPYSPDISGIIERAAIVIAVVLGGRYILTVPVIVLVRAFFLTGKTWLREFSEIIKRDEPAVEFQKIRLKSEIAVSMVASPAIGIMFGLIAAFL
jgi:hypothetical protein